MENKEVSYIKVDDNRIINEKQIRWIQKIDECLHICTRSNGCSPRENTNKLCKINNFDSYTKLNKLFM